MEIDIGQESNTKLYNTKNENIFALDYLNQKIDNNADFQKWKRKMLVKNGNDAKFFKCNQDMIYFCTTYYDCLRSPSFKGKCPICSKDICLFCSNNYKERSDWIQCCIRRALNKAIFYYSLRYIKRYDDVPFDDHIHIIIFVPGINLLVLFIKCMDILYLDLPTKKSISDNNGKLYSFRERLEEGCVFVIFFILIFAIGFTLCISFLIYNIYLIILLFIISIPFKFYPLKYYYGIILDF